MADRHEMERMETGRRGETWIFLDILTEMPRNKREDRQSSFAMLHQASAIKGRGKNQHNNTTKHDCHVHVSLAIAFRLSLFVRNFLLCFP